MIRRRRLAIGLAALNLGIARPASSDTQPLPVWPDDQFHRQAALTLLEELREALLTENSATVTLERWCRTHRIADDPTIVADRDPAHEQPITQEQRTALGIGSDEPVRYRHVRLSCGGRLLSEADNWYVPARLTPAMNATLETSHIPFGKAVAALHFTRTTLSSRLLWSPLRAGRPGRAQASGRLAIPETLIENRAVLADQAGHRFSLLVETYHAGILAFPPPQR
jgi:chorismate-pyruvate lyase